MWIPDSKGIYPDLLATSGNLILILIIIYFFFTMKLNELFFQQAITYGCGVLVNLIQDWNVF